MRAFKKSKVNLSDAPKETMRWPSKRMKDGPVGALQGTVKSVDIVIVKISDDEKKEVLLGRLDERWSDNGKYEWGVAGREILGKENWKKTVFRNVADELGCEVVMCKKFCENENNALGNHYMGIGVLAEISGEPKVLTPQDWNEWRWFSIDDIPKKLFPAAKKVIDAYLNSVGRSTSLE